MEIAPVRAPFLSHNNGQTLHSRAFCIGANEAQTKTRDGVYQTNRSARRARAMTQWSCPGHQGLIQRVNEYLSLSSLLAIRRAVKSPYRHKASFAPNAMSIPPHPRSIRLFPRR
jgi:hypothetical protein